MVIFSLKGLKNATTTTNSLKMPVWKAHKNRQEEKRAQEQKGWEGNQGFGPLRPKCHQED